MSQERKAAVGAGKGDCEVSDLSNFRQQGARAHGHIAQASRERLWIAAVAREIECHGYIPVARQRYREGLHQLLRTCEAMRNYNHRTCFQRA